MELDLIEGQFFRIQVVEMAKIFGKDMTSSTKIDNRKKDILILGNGQTQGLEQTLNAEEMYSIDFSKGDKKFCLSLHYHGANNYLFVNGTEIIKFKAKDSEIVPNPLSLGSFSKDWTVDKMRKNGFIGYICDFSVDYDAIAVDDILNIHNHLFKKNDKYNKMFGFIKQCFFTGLTFLSTLTNVNMLGCISMNKQECKVRPQIVNVNGDDPVFFSF